jgi:hypothetical protein
VLVRVTRRGGLAGLTKTAALEVDERAARVLARLGPSGPPHPDGFEYRFELDDGRVVTVPEHALPRELDPVLDEFAKKAELPPTS